MSIGIYYTSATSVWNLNSLPFNLPQAITDQILSIALPLCPIETTDGISWNLTHDGLFSLKSAYNTQIPPNPQHKNMLWLWKSPCNQREFFFTWKWYNKGIRTTVRLNKINIIPSPIYPLCQIQNETVKHAL